MGSWDPNCYLRVALRRLSPSWSSTFSARVILHFMERLWPQFKDAILRSENETRYACETKYADLVQRERNRDRYARVATETSRYSVKLPGFCKTSGILVDANSDGWSHWASTYERAAQAAHRA